MKIISDKKNELLGRREILFAVEGKSNPGFAQAVSIAAKEFETDEGLIAIKSIKSSFGSNEFIIEAFAYNTSEGKMRSEPKPKEKKKEAVA